MKCATPPPPTHFDTHPLRYNYLIVPNRTTPRSYKHPHVNPELSDSCPKLSDNWSDLHPHASAPLLGQLPQRHPYAVLTE